MSGKLDQPVAAQPAHDGDTEPLSGWWIRWLDSMVKHVNHIRTGEGSPEAVVVADVGTLYLRTDGGAGTTLYVKESSPTPSTGWVGK